MGLKINKSHPGQAYASARKKQLRFPGMVPVGVLKTLREAACKRGDRNRFIEEQRYLATPWNER